MYHAMRILIYKWTLSYSSNYRRSEVHPIFESVIVVLVCAPKLVEESLKAMEGRTSNTAALISLMGRGGLGWDGLLADTRYGEAQSRLPTSADGVA